MDPDFREECRRFAFRFCCEHCAYLDRGTGECAHAWPTREHRLAFYEEEDCEEVVFCKEFELY
jgi:hypothetical protein